MTDAKSTKARVRHTLRWRPKAKSEDPDTGYEHRVDWATLQAGTVLGKRVEAYRIECNLPEIPDSISGKYLAFYEFAPDNAPRAMPEPTPTVSQVTSHARFTPAYTDDSGLGRWTYINVCLGMFDTANEARTACSNHFAGTFPGQWFNCGGTVERF